MVFHIKMSLPSKQILEFLHKINGKKRKKRGLYIIFSVELFLPCIAFQECVGQSKNNETMHIITFLELLRGKNQPAAILC